MRVFYPRAALRCRCVAVVRALCRPTKPQPWCTVGCAGSEADPAASDAPLPSSLPGSAAEELLGGGSPLAPTARHESAPTEAAPAACGSDAAPSYAPLAQQQQQQQQQPPTPAAPRLSESATQGALDPNVDCVPSAPLDAAEDAPQAPLRQPAGLALQPPVAPALPAPFAAASASSGSGGAAQATHGRDAGAGTGTGAVPARHSRHLRDQSNTAASFGGSGPASGTAAGSLKPKLSLSAALGLKPTSATGLHARLSSAHAPFVKPRFEEPKQHHQPAPPHRRHAPADAGAAPPLQPPQLHQAHSGGSSSDNRARSPSLPLTLLSPPPLPIAKPALGSAAAAEPPALLPPSASAARRSSRHDDGASLAPQGPVSGSGGALVRHDTRQASSAVTTAAPPSTMPQQQLQQRSPAASPLDAAPEPQQQQQPPRKAQASSGQGDPSSSPLAVPGRSPAAKRKAAHADADGKPSADKPSGAKASTPVPSPTRHKPALLLLPSKAEDAPPAATSAPPPAPQPPPRPAAHHAAPLPPSACLPASLLYDVSPSQDSPHILLPPAPPPISSAAAPPGAAAQPHATASTAAATALASGPGATAGVMPAGGGADARQAETTATTPAAAQGKPAQGLPSGGSTPWDTQAWDAIDALERRHVAAAAAAAAALTGDTTAPPAAAPGTSTVPPPPVRAHLPPPLPTTTAPAAATTVPSAALFVSPPAAAAAAAGGAGGGPITLAEAGSALARRPGGGASAPPTAAGGSTSPSGVSRVPETAPPSARSMLLSEEELQGPITRSVTPALPLAALPLAAAQQRPAGSRGPSREPSPGLPPPPPFPPQHQLQSAPHQVLAAAAAPPPPHGPTAGQPVSALAALPSGAQVPLAPPSAAALAPHPLPAPGRAPLLPPRATGQPHAAAPPVPAAAAAAAAGVAHGGGSGGNALAKRLDFAPAVDDAAAGGAPVAVPLPPPAAPHPHLWQQQQQQQQQPAAPPPFPPPPPPGQQQAHFHPHPPTTAAPPQAPLTSPAWPAPPPAQHPQQHAWAAAPAPVQDVDMAPQPYHHAHPGPPTRRSPSPAPQPPPPPSAAHPSPAGLHPPTTLDHAMAPPLPAPGPHHAPTAAAAPPAAPPPQPPQQQQDAGGGVWRRPRDWMEMELEAEERHGPLEEDPEEVAARQQQRQGAMDVDVMDDDLGLDHEDDMERFPEGLSQAATQVRIQRMLGQAASPALLRGGGAGGGAAMLRTPMARKPGAQVRFPSHCAPLPCFTHCTLWAGPHACRRGVWCVAAKTSPGAGSEARASPAAAGPAGTPGQQQPPAAQAQAQAVQLGASLQGQSTLGSPHTTSSGPTQVRTAPLCPCACRAVRFASVRSAAARAVADVASPPRAGRERCQARAGPPVVVSAGAVACLRCVWCGGADFLRAEVVPARGGDQGVPGGAGRAQHAVRLAGERCARIGGATPRCLKRELRNAELPRWRSRDACERTARSSLFDARALPACSCSSSLPSSSRRRSA